VAIALFMLSAPVRGQAARIEKRGLMIQIFVSLMFLVTASAFGQQGPAGQLGCYGDPVCPECGPGQCVVSSGGVLVSPGDYSKTNNPACAEGLDDAVNGIKGVFDQAASAALEAWVGPIGSKLYDAFGGNTLREAVRLFDRRSSCVSTGVKAPGGATIERVVFYWSEGDGQHRNEPANKDLHYCRWENVQTTATGAGPVVTALFKNWSHDRTRTATVHVLYQPRSWSGRYVKNNPVSVDGTVWNPRTGGPR
jgi:hypothetical protein